MDKKPIDENEYCNHKIINPVNSSLIGGFISIVIGMVCLESISKSLKQTFKY